MSFVTVNGITLNYSLSGVAGGVPMVFLNSLGTNLHIWDDVASHFADRYHIVCYDKRGHGLSDCPPGPYTLEDHTQDVAGLLEYLEVKRAILIGVSVGGMIALNYAITYPDRVQALVLCDTGAKIGTAVFWDERIAAIEKNGLEPLAEAILSRWFSTSFKEKYPAWYQGYANMLVRTPATGYLATCATLRDGDLREDAQHVQTKTLVVCGAEDLATPPSLGHELAELLPNGRFELIPEAAHLPSIERPEVLATVIRQFLSQQ